MSEQNELKLIDDLVSFRFYGSKRCQSRRFDQIQNNLLLITHFFDHTEPRNLVLSDILSFSMSIHIRSNESVLLET